MTTHLQGEMFPGEVPPAPLSTDEILAYLRMQLAHLSLGRSLGDGQGWVTADDARDLLFQGKPCTPPDNMNFLGQLFRAPGWITDGRTVASRTRGRKGSRILRWRWNGGAGA